MAQTKKRTITPVFTSEEYAPAEPQITTDATPLLIFSFPTPENGYSVEIAFSGTVPNTINTYVGKIGAMYKRPTGGDITKIVDDYSIGSESSSFPAGNFPTIYTSPNIIDQTIEVYVEGLNGYTISWIFDIIIRFRTL